MSKKKFKNTRILCVGDIILDSYVYGDVERISPEAPIPILKSYDERFILGGAGNIGHIREAIRRYNIIGVAAGSLFVFKGKYKAVLINYPDRKTRDEIYY